MSKKIKVERINCTKKKKFPMSENLHDFRKAEKKICTKDSKSVRERERLSWFVKKRMILQEANLISRKNLPSSS